MEPTTRSLTETTDAYLEYHRHSPEAQQRVCDVLNKFDFMVTLATQRAMDALPVPASNVIQFPMDRVRAIPDGAA